MVPNRYFILIDNLRFDSVENNSTVIQEYYKVDKEESYYSILPTANAIRTQCQFSADSCQVKLKTFPDQWLNDEEEAKKLHEEAFMQAQMKRLGKDIKMSYNKITNFTAGKNYPTT